jgi:hypothetical protein
MLIAFSVALCRSILPDRCRKANKSAACIATTAMIAPLRSRGLMSVR